MTILSNLKINIKSK